MPTLRPRKRQSQAPAALPQASQSTERREDERPAINTSASSPVATAAESAGLHDRKRITPGSPGQTRSRDQRQRHHHTDEMSRPDEERPLLDGHGVAVSSSAAAAAAAGARDPGWAKRNQWIVLALASGACAAFNGVFAKLTTTELTAKFAAAVARLLGLGSAERVVELAVRGTFFGLNLAFNGVMWTLFTTALARGNSTTQVSIINTSSNFVITAILGLLIFSESLPPLWWLGAALLVAGNVIVGQKDEGVQKEDERAHAETDTDDEALAPAPGSAAANAPSGSAVGGPVQRNVEGVEKDEDVADLGSSEAPE